MPGWVKSPSVKGKATHRDLCTPREQELLVMQPEHRNALARSCRQLPQQIYTCSGLTGSEQGTASTRAPLDQALLVLSPLLQLPPKSGSPISKLSSMNLQSYLTGERTEEILEHSIHGSCLSHHSQKITQWQGRGGSPRGAIPILGDKSQKDQRMKLPAPTSYSCLAGPSPLDPERVYLPCL